MFQLAQWKNICEGGIVLTVVAFWLSLAQKLVFVIIKTGLLFLVKN